jgi:hypothetical protein
VPGTDFLEVVAHLHARPPRQHVVHLVFVVRRLHVPGSLGKMVDAEGQRRRAQELPIVGLAGAEPRGEIVDVENLPGVVAHPLSLLGGPL